MSRICSDFLKKMKEIEDRKPENIAVRKRLETATAAEAILGVNLDDIVTDPTSAHLIQVVTIISVKALELAKKEAEAAAVEKEHLAEQTRAASDAKRKLDFVLEAFKKAETLDDAPVEDVPVEKKARTDDA